MSEQHEIYKVRHRRLDNQSKIIEKIYHRFAGVECPCGHKVFKQIRFHYLDYHYQADTFRCSKCEMVPLTLPLVPFKRLGFDFPMSLNLGYVNNCGM